MRAERLDLVRFDGKTIRCLVDRPARGGARTPVVVVVPPYARTVRNAVGGALFLTSNDFECWRFDYTNHIGASDGEIYDFTMSSAVADLTAVVTAARAKRFEAPLGIVCGSLGARVAFRAFSTKPGPDALISVIGVVHIRETLARVMGHDFVGDLLAGHELPVAQEVLGYKVGREFIHDVVAKNFYSLQSTHDDVLACAFPISHVAAEEDAWTRRADLEYVFGNHAEHSACREMWVAAGSSHKLENNPIAGREVWCHAVKRLAHYLTDINVVDDNVKIPGFSAIVAKNHEEQDLGERPQRFSSKSSPHDSQGAESGFHASSKGER